MRRKIKYGFRILYGFLLKPFKALTGVRLTGKQLICPKARLITEEKGKIQATCSNNIDDGTFIKAVKGIVRLNGCYINRNCNIVAMERITIEDGVTIGPNVCIYDHDHNMAHLKDKSADPYITAPVYIGKGAWIGANAVILKGVTVGAYSVIAAGAVVTKDVPDHVIAGGVPAKVIGSVK